MEAPMKSSFDRRAFLGAAIASPLLSRAASSGEPASSVARVAGAAGPGRRLVLSGLVLQPDGRTPFAGAAIDVYQTDSDGWYSRPESNPRRARLRGSLVTDASGAYRIDTILPGRYGD